MYIIPYCYFALLVSFRGVVVNLIHFVYTKENYTGTGDYPNRAFPFFYIDLVYFCFIVFVINYTSIVIYRHLRNYVSTETYYLQCIISTNIVCMIQNTHAASRDKFHYSLLSLQSFSC